MPEPTIEVETNPDEQPHPWTVIMQGLTAEALGQPVDTEAMQEACTLIAAAQLVHAGLSMDTVEALFRDRDHTFKVAYDKATEDITVDIVWLDEDGAVAGGDDPEAPAPNAMDGFGPAYPGADR